MISPRIKRIDTNFTKPHEYTSIRRLDEVREAPLRECKWNRADAQKQKQVKRTSKNLSLNAGIEFFHVIFGSLLAATASAEARDSGAAAALAYICPCMG